VTNLAGEQLRLQVVGPTGTTVLARAVQADAVTKSWADGYQRVDAMTFTVRCPVRPFIGLSPSSSPKLAGFLRQQGYIVETVQANYNYSYYLDQAEFTAEHERIVLAQIDGTDRPLLRLGRWPNGAHSALAITGDIDALTLWDWEVRASKHHLCTMPQFFCMASRLSRSVSAHVGGSFSSYSPTAAPF